MKSNKLCRMKKVLLPMLVSLQLLFGSCENNFDPYIYGALLQENILPQSKSMFPI